MGRQQPSRGAASRVADIYGLVVDGLPYAQIVRFVAANCTWKVSERTIDSYIASRARADASRSARSSAREVFAESLARKQRLFARASTGNQLKTALAVQNSIDRMFGDFAGERDELSDVDRFLEAMLGAD